MIYTLLIIFVILVGLVIILKRIGYLKFALKAGLCCLLLFLTACFLYGLFNRFSFMHGSSPPGLDSSMAYMFFGGIIAGPFMFVVGAVCIALAVYFRKR